MSTDPLAGILSEAEANRRRERAAQNSAVTVSTPAATGDYTVAGSAPGSPVLLDDNGKVPQALTYPPSAGQTARSYQHDQTSASTVWQVPHQLGGYPPVVVLDGTGALINAEIHYPDDNNVTVVFGRPETGVAHLSL